MIFLQGRSRPHRFMDIRVAFKRKCVGKRGSVKENVLHERVGSGEIKHSLHPFAPLPSLYNDCFLNLYPPSFNLFFLFF